jgi:hypothetical protein
MANRPPVRPGTSANASNAGPGADAGAGTANTGSVPSMTPRQIVLTTTAAPTGIRLRGRHSNNSSSTASRIEASGALNVAAMPPAAPTTSAIPVITSTLGRTWKFPNPATECCIH